MSLTLIAIDPGSKGGIAVCNPCGSVTAMNMPETCADLYRALGSVANAFHDIPHKIRCYIEEVSGYIGEAQPGSSAFNFGRSFGNIEGILTALEIPFIMVRPQTWQKAMNVPKTGPKQKAKRDATEEERKAVRRYNAALKRDHKNVMKEMAQRLFPHIEVTLPKADALLILEYARRIEIVENKIVPFKEENKIVPLVQPQQDLDGMFKTLAELKDEDK